jgi:hypothetical protein
VQCREMVANVMGQLCALRPCVELVESAINDRLTSTSLSLNAFSPVIAACKEKKIRKEAQVFCLSICLSVCLSVWTVDQLCKHFPAYGN